jgi:O-antigen/teichoic acid export membrane protein
MTNRLVDKWYIAAFRSGDFGVYAVAAQEVPLLAVIPYAGGAALATGLVEAFRTCDLARARSHWISLTTSMTLVVVPLGVGLILVAPELLTAAFTNEFGPGVVPFQLFTIVTLHRVAEYGMLLRVAGRTRDVLVVAAWTLASNAVLAGFGAWFGGMTGASLGTVLASGVGWLIALRRIADTFKVPVSAAFPWATWCTVLAGSALAAGAGQFVASGSDHPATRLMLKLLTYSLAVVPVVSIAQRFLDLTSSSAATDRGLTVVEAA